jgi:hypothetical protein
MVGDHHINRPVASGLPTISRNSLGRELAEHICQRRAICNRFREKMQVMGTGFHTHGKPFGACSAQLLKSLAGREMDDV